MNKIKGVHVNSITYGNPQGQDVVLLHGWGQNIDMMKPVGDALQKDYLITIIDLPGHGLSEEPETAWQLDDFVEILKQLLDELKIKKPILIAHSFGGKISLLYASRYPVEKLVLFGSPFKKAIKKETAKMKLLKSLKKVPILNQFEEYAKKHIGSTDYRNASPVMRKIMVNHVNLDITENVKKITCPTIIIWGTRDEAVPLSDAYELASLLDDAAVIEYEGCTHYAYLEDLGRTVRIIKNFIGSE